MQTTVLILLAVVVVIAVAVFIVHRSRSSFPASGVALQGAMERRSKRAVAQAKRMNVALDFSPQSVERVERLLTAMHLLRSANRMSDSLVNQNSLDYGSYIGEVLRRLKRGQWQRDHSQFGPNCFPLTVGDAQIFPVAWVEKRIENGPEDDVWFKFQTTMATHVG